MLPSVFAAIMLFIGMAILFSPLGALIQGGALRRWGAGLMAILIGIKFILVAARYPGQPIPGLIWTICMWVTCFMIVWPARKKLRKRGE